MKDMPEIWLCAAQIFDGYNLLDAHGIHIDDGQIIEILPQFDIPASADKRFVEGIISPGFFDIQVNGGADVLFNTQPDTAGLAKISKALRKAGTTHWLPTVITDTPDVLTAACDAVCANIGKMGVSGIHIEGPHIAVDRRGAHNAEWVRPFDSHSLALLTMLRHHQIPVLLTVAPEVMKCGEIAHLVGIGVVVSIGHSNANAAQTQQALDEGAQAFTHLFNAMSQIETRNPNVVGTAINSTSYCSMIADGMHVDLQLLAMAIRARPISDRMILVTDAMPTVGGSNSFDLYGNTIRLENGRLVNSEGLLAGAHITVLEEIRNMVKIANMPLVDVLRMATSNPAKLLGLEKSVGAIQSGSSSALLVLDHDLTSLKLL